MKKSLYCLVGASVLWLGCSVQEPESVPELSRSEQSVVGGTSATPGQFPWQARLTVNGNHSCGGSLIHPKWVLTAGHCVDGVPPSSMNVVLGDHQINQYESTEQVRTVRRFILHPDYQSVNGAPVNDVALIELNTPVTLTAAVQTIELQASQASNVSHTLSGWGWAYGGSGQPSNTLLTASLPVTDNSSCNAAPLARSLFASELCAGYLSNGSGGCHGDSGGPLVTQGSQPKLVGVVSWGRGYTCDSYTVFARVSSFVSWIDSKVNCNPCPMSGSNFDGANCYVATPPAGTSAFTYAGNLYYTPLSSPVCPMSGSNFDGANCYVATPPAGTSAFVSGNNLYYTPIANLVCPMNDSFLDGGDCNRGKLPTGRGIFADNDGNLYYTPLPGDQCPMTGSWFDGMNCYVGTLAAGSTYYTRRGTLYYTASYSYTCPLAGSWFDGSNCYVGTPPAGTSAFIYQGNLYHTPAYAYTCPLSGSNYDGANCYVGTPPAGTSPFVYCGALYYTPLCQ